MKNVTWSIKVPSIATVFMGFALSVCSMPASYAAPGCCSNHGGVASCAHTGYQQCKDKSISPSCKCSKPAKSAAKTVKKTQVKSKVAD